MAPLPRYVARAARVPSLERLVTRHPSLVGARPGSPGGAVQPRGWNVWNAVLRIVVHSGASHWSAGQLIMMA